MIADFRFDHTADILHGQPAVADHLTRIFQAHSPQSETEYSVPFLIFFNPSAVISRNISLSVLIVITISFHRINFLFPLARSSKFDLLLWGGTASVSELNRNNLVPGLICVVLITFFCSVILGIVPFYMRYVKLQGQKKQLLENSSFITMNNLDYYRDKLTGITPGAISMLEDLQLEPDKDLTACILRYEMLDDLGNGDSFGTYSEYLFEAPARLWKLTLVIGINCVFLLLFLFPVLYMNFGQGKTQEYSPYKRTAAGICMRNISTE